MLLVPSSIMRFARMSPLSRPLRRKGGYPARLADFLLLDITDPIAQAMTLLCQALRTAVMYHTHNN